MPTYCHLYPRTLPILPLFFWTLAGPLAAPPAQAEVFRCLDPRGAVAFSDSPCPAGTRQETIELEVPSSGWDSARIAADNRQLLEDYEARRTRERAARETAWARERSARIEYEERLRIREREMAAELARPRTVVRQFGVPRTGCRVLPHGCGPWPWTRAPERQTTVAPPSRFPKTPRAPMNLR